MRARLVLLLALGSTSAALVGCGGRPAQSTTLVTSTSPASSTKPDVDLAGAKQGGAVPDSDGRRAGTGAGTTPQRTDGPQVYDLDTVHLVVVGHDSAGEPIVEATTARPLFEKANAALDAGKQEEALALYRTVIAEFPESKYAPASHYNIGIVHEARGEIDLAIAAYRDLVKTYPTGRDSIDAHMRVAALQAERDQWPESAATLTEILARTDLEHADRIEALARKGYVTLERGDQPGAEALLNEAISVFHRAQRIEDQYFVAMAHYYLAQLAHRQFLAAPMRQPYEQLRADIDAKEALAVVAYDRYKVALGFRNAYWATASGYQMSQLFMELWQSAVKAPIPQELDARAHNTYAVEVHDRVRRDLEKALDGHRMNVELAGAYGVGTVWSDGSKQRAAQILDILAREARGELVVP